MLGDLAVIPVLSGMLYALIGIIVAVNSIVEDRPPLCLRGSAISLGLAFVWPLAIVAVVAAILWNRSARMEWSWTRGGDRR
jgi:hypothetical protein